MSLARNAPAIPGALADDVGFLLARCGAMTIRAVDQALEPLGLRVRHYAILTLAAEGAGTSQRAVGALLGLDPSVVVALIDELEREGLAERRPKPGDRRTRLVTVTPAGLSTLGRARAAAAAVHDGILAPLDQDQRRLLVAFLQQLLPDPG